MRFLSVFAVALLVATFAGCATTGGYSSPALALRPKQDGVHTANPCITS